MLPRVPNLNTGPLWSVADDWFRFRLLGFPDLLLRTILDLKDPVCWDCRNPSLLGDAPLQADGTASPWTICKSPYFACHRIGGLFGDTHWDLNSLQPTLNSSYTDPKPTIWVVVKTMVPFWCVFCYGPKRDHNFDNHPHADPDHGSQLSASRPSARCSTSGRPRWCPAQQHGVKSGFKLLGGDGRSKDKTCYSSSMICWVLVLKQAL